MNKMIKGTWFEFRHLNEREGKYLNTVLENFSAEQWRAQINDIKSLGMEYLVLHATATNNEAFFASPKYKPFKMAVPDPFEILLSTADELDMKVFVANDFVAPWDNAWAMITDKDINKRREAYTHDLAELYSHHKSFYGWYWTNEAAIHPYFAEEFIDYVNRNSALARKLTPGKKTLIAPYGTFRVKTDDHYVDQLERMDVDIIAYQDEIGVKKAVPFWTPRYFESLRKAHDRAERCGALWADVEVFEFEDAVYTSALLPATFDRVKAQMQGIQDFVDEILIYEYQGLFSRPGSIASTGLDSEKLYCDYSAYLTEIQKQK